MVTDRIPASELERRGRKITLLLTDCDGVLTDGSVLYTSDGGDMRSFSVIDGMGVEMLHAAGIRVGVVSGEVAGSISRRAEKLRLDPVFLGVKDKKQCVLEFLEEKRMSHEEVAYFGDDINDLPLMQYLSEISITACPANGHRSLSPFVHYRAAAGGGRGAFRELAEWLLSLRGIQIDAYPINVSSKTPHPKIKENLPV